MIQKNIETARQKTHEDNGKPSGYPQLPQISIHHPYKKYITTEKINHSKDINI